MNFNDPYERARTVAHIRGTPESPWLTREGILKALDNELCLYDKARAQRVSKDDAQKTGICWLADYISKIHVWRRRATNPLLSKDKIVRCHCCDVGECLFHLGWDTYPPTIIGHELAIEYWEIMNQQPLIVIPEAPPLFPDSNKETWIVFEKDDLNYYNMVVYPQALRRIEWEKKYFGRSLSEFLDWHKNEIWDRWIGSGENNGWYSRWVKNGDIWEIKEEKSGWKVRLVHEDGKDESLPGVYYPGQQIDWRLKRNVEWNRILTRLQFWLDIGEQTHWGSPERRERFSRWCEEIGRYLDGRGAEPKEDIDLKKEISSKEEEFIEKCIRELAHSIVADMFGHTNESEHRAPLVWEIDDEKP